MRCRAFARSRAECRGGYATRLKRKGEATEGSPKRSAYDVPIVKVATMYKHQDWSIRRRIERDVDVQVQAVFALDSGANMRRLISNADLRATRGIRGSIPGRRAPWRDYGRGGPSKSTDGRCTIRHAQKGTVGVKHKTLHGPTWSHYYRIITQGRGEQCREEDGAIHCTMMIWNEPVTARNSTGSRGVPPMFPLA